MTDCIHLVKLSVGSETVEDMSEWQTTRRAQTDDGLPRHITRMWPKREQALLNGGSIFSIYAQVHFGALLRSILTFNNINSFFNL